MISCQSFPKAEHLPVDADEPVIQLEEQVVVKQEATVEEAGENEKQASDTGKAVAPAELLRYAKTLLGTPYKYASIDPNVGLDCSGFITHVFNHFFIQVPRSSIDFTNYGMTIHPTETVPGDLVLFTGTDTLTEVVGHMGIVTGTAGGVIEFIHSTSGKAYGVTITTLNAHYQKRFVKVIRVPYTATAGL